MSRATITRDHCGKAPSSIKGERTVRRFCAGVAAAAVLLSHSAIYADDLSTGLSTIVGTLAASPAEVATKNVLALNTAMFDLYSTSAQLIKANILAHHPVILGLFSGAGGRFILYRPGEAPLETPSAPIAYQVLKSVGHSTMALSVIVMPYLKSPDDKSWLASLLAYRSKMQSALDGIDQTDMPAEWRANSQDILQNNIKFMDECAAKGAIAPEALQAFATKQGPLLKRNIAWAAQTQVVHWMGVIDGWKKMLGSQWDQTYAASNTIYVARQNNILFSVLAQFFGPEAINDRLLLIETISFTTTPDELLDSLTRIIGDRSVGAAFFGNYRLMDFELMGGDARAAIIAEDAKRGMTPVLPPAVPFGSRQWPALVTSGPGASSLADLP
jgi:hypothetical protein